MSIHSRVLPAVAALGLLSSMLTGCAWLHGDRDPTPPTELTDIVEQVRIDRIWSVRVTHGTDERSLYLVPAIAAGRIYAADADGKVVAVSADSGKILWEEKTRLSFSGGPDVRDNRLVLGTSQGQIVALSTQDGHELWRGHVDSEVLSVPRLTDDGKVIVHTLDDDIYALDANTGKQVWHLVYPAPVLTLRGSSTPTMAPDGVIVGLSGGRLLKFLTSDGTPVWDVTITRPSGRSEIARITDIDASPVLVGKTLYVGTYNGDLAAVDATTGTVLWRRELSSHAGLAANDQDLFITDSKDRVWNADPATGAGRWKQDALLYRKLTAPTIIGNLVAVGDLEGYIHLLTKYDGRLVGRIRVVRKTPITARPIAVGRRLYVYADDGTLAALDIGQLSASYQPARKTTTTGPEDLTPDSSAQQSSPEMVP